MLKERIDSRPHLRLVPIESGIWLRPAVRALDAVIAVLPAPYWASAPRRGGLRRSTVRVTCREAYRRRPRRTEIYRLAGAPSAATAAPRVEAVLRPEPAPHVRTGVLRLAADLICQVFKPVGEAR